MLTQLIELIVKEKQTMAIVLGVVKSVSGDSIHVVRDGKADLLNVRLNSVLTDVKDRFVLVPKVGSVVICGVIENQKTSAVLLSCSEVEKVEVEIDGLEFKMTEGKFLFKNEKANLKEILKNSLNAIKAAKIPTPTGGIGVLSPDAIALIEKEVNLLNQLFV